MAAALLTFALLVGLSAALSGTAAAADGRATTPEGEIAAQYVHSLDRRPDAAGLANYMRFVRENCQWGVVDASYRIATSGEAVNRWRNNPQDLAGMLYASLLDRAPDPGGLRAYTDSIRVRGLPLSTAEMLGSSEYRQRLARICGASDGLSASMYDWQAAMSFAEDVLVAKAYGLGASCAVLKGIKRFTGLKQNAAGVRAFIGVAGEITNKIHGKLDGTCGAAVTYLKAALRIAVIVNSGAGYNPVFIQLDSHRSWATLRGVTYFAVRIGPLPTVWNKYSGKVAG